MQVKGTRIVSFRLSCGCMFSTSTQGDAMQVKGTRIVSFRLSAETMRQLDAIASTIDERYQERGMTYRHGTRSLALRTAVMMLADDLAAHPRRKLPLTDH